MSGIAGICNIDGAPVDRALLQRMTDAIAHRGPDGIHHWVDGPVGMGHCMLQTTPESVYERQPLTDESGNLCLTMDGRVDNREELISALESKGARLRDDTDAELVLKSYECWGEDCPVHILGDFAFVIWDKRQRQMFCARDQLGVKPLYYASVRNSVLFSNSLACLRTNPSITAALDERAIGDFLLFDSNLYLSTTTFEDIQRLPPGHCLSCSDVKQSVRRYWSLPVEDEIHYRRQRDYVDHFNALMRRAVRDRLRTKRAAVLMSGGLDSSSVAATACRVMQGSPETSLHAFTYVYDRLMQDRERYYSGLVTQALGVPIHFLAQDGYRLFERAEQLQRRAPDPINEPFQAITADQLKDVAEISRVALTGDGGDPVFYGNQACLTEMLSSFRVGELAKSAVYFCLHRKRAPRLGLRTLFRRALGIRRFFCPEYPTWLNTSFEARYDLRARWEEKTRPSSPVHPRRPESYECLTDPMWQQLFAAYGPDLNRSPVDVRHPFFDVRLLRYMLRVPSFPWCSEKLILRVAMRGMLPERVRMRPKTTIVADPILVRLKQQGQFSLPVNSGGDQILEYVDRAKVRQVLSSPNSAEIWANVRPISLSYWLSGVAAVG